MMGFYKNAIIDMRERGLQVRPENIPRLTALRAAVKKPNIRPIERLAMSTNRPNPSHKEGNGAQRDAESNKANARGSPGDHSAGLHKEAQDPGKQPSSRGGGGLAPSDAPVLLLHRRGRADSNMLQDFADERKARGYAKEHKLMIVHSEKVGDQLKLYYLPE